MLHCEYIIIHVPDRDSMVWEVRPFDTNDDGFHEAHRTIGYAKTRHDAQNLAWFLEQRERAIQEVCDLKATIDQMTEEADANGELMEQLLLQLSEMRASLAVHDGYIEPDDEHAEPSVSLTFGELFTTQVDEEVDQEMFNQYVARRTPARNYLDE